MANRGTYEILVVDDDATTLILASTALSDPQYQIACAPGGAAALKMLKSCAFDLIVLDMIMPGVDGFAVLRAVRSSPDLKDICVLAMSQRTDPELIERARTFGANDFISKPLDWFQVTGKIQQLLSQRPNDGTKQATRHTYPPNLKLK